MFENQTIFPLLVSLILLSTGVLMQQHITGIDEQYGLYSESGFFDSVSSGFKKFIAHECWLQADVYLHQGLRHGHEDEHKDGADLGQAAESGAHSDNETECTFCGSEGARRESRRNLLVPYDREDFLNTRHDSGPDDRDLLPWFRLTAYMDPHLTKAYANGGHWLAWRLDKPNEAIEFLEEGLENNPGAPDVLAELGLIYFDIWEEFGTRDYHRAIQAFSGALKTEPDWSNYIELLTYRLECYEALGEYKKAVSDVEQKIGLMTKYGIGNSPRAQNARAHREKLLNRLPGG